MLHGCICPNQDQQDSDQPNQVQSTVIEPAFTKQVILRGKNGQKAVSKMAAKNFLRNYNVFLDTLIYLRYMYLLLQT